MSHTRLILSKLASPFKGKITISPLKTHLCNLTENELKIINIKTHEEKSIQNVKDFICVLLGKNEGVVYYTSKLIMFYSFTNGETRITDSLKNENLILHATQDGFIVCIFRPYRNDTIYYNSQLRHFFLSPLKDNCIHASNNNILAVINPEKKMTLFLPNMPQFVLSLSFLYTLPKMFTFTPDLEYFAFVFDEKVLIFHNRNSVQMLQMNLQQIDYFFQICAQDKHCFWFLEEKYVTDIYLTNTTIYCLIGNEIIKIFNINETNEEPNVTEDVHSYSFIGQGNCGTLVALENDNVVCYTRDVKAQSLLRGMTNVGFEKIWNVLVDENEELQKMDKKMIEFEDCILYHRIDQAKQLLKNMQLNQVEQALKMTNEIYDKGIAKQMYYRELAMIAEVGLACIVRLISLRGNDKTMEYRFLIEKFVKAVKVKEEMLRSTEEQEKKNEEEIMKRNGNYTDFIVEERIGLLDGLMNGNIINTMNNYGFKYEEIKVYSMKFVYQFIATGEIKKALQLLLRLGYKDLTNILKELYEQTHIIQIRKEIESIMNELEFGENEFMKEYDEYFEKENEETKYTITIKSPFDKEEKLEGEMTEEVMKKYGISYLKSLSESIATIPRIDNSKGQHISLNIRETQSLTTEEKEILLREEGKKEKMFILYDLMHDKRQNILRILQNGDDEKSIETIIQNRDFATRETRDLIDLYLMQNPTDDLIKEAEEKGLESSFIRNIIVGNANGVVKKEYLNLMSSITYLPFVQDVLNRYDGEIPIQWMQKLNDMYEWNDTNEETALMNRIDKEIKHSQTTTLKELYETLMKIKYDPIDPMKLPFPKKVIPTYAMILEDYLNDNRLIEVIRKKELMKNTTEILQMSQKLRESASIVKEFLGDENIRLNTMIKNILEEEDNYYYINETSEKNQNGLNQSYQMNNLNKSYMGDIDDGETNTFNTSNNLLSKSDYLMNYNNLNSFNTYEEEEETPKPIDKIKEIIKENGTILIEELDIIENKEDFIKYLERRSQPGNSASELCNFLANRWKLPVSMKPIQQICENETLVELLEYCDKHGYQDKQLTKIVKDYWPESPSKGHILAIDDKQEINKNIDKILNEFCDEEKSGLSYMNWIFDPEDSSVLLVKYFDSALKGYTDKSFSCSNIEKEFERLIYELMDDEFGNERIIEGLEFFDKQNPLTSFFKMVQLIAVARFSDIIQLKKELNTALQSTWKIGTAECIERIMMFTLKKFIRIFNESTEKIARITKELIGIPNIYINIKIVADERRSMRKLINHYHLPLKYDCEKEILVQQLIKIEEFESAHSFCVKYLQEDIFLPIEKEIGQIIKKSNLKGIEKWHKINSIINKRTCKPVDAGRYFYNELLKLYDYEDFERSYQMIADEMLVIINYSLDWLNKENGNCKEAEDLKIEVTKFRHIYEESKHRDVPAQYIGKACDKSIYYIVNRGDYSLAMMMNEKLNLDEMKIFKDAYDFVLEEINYSLPLSEGEQYLTSLMNKSMYVKKGIDLLKMRYSIGYKYFEDRTTFLAAIHDSSSFRQRRLSIIPNICGINTFKKHASKLTSWNVIFEEAKEYIQKERITDEELAPILSRIYVDIASSVKPISIQGFPIFIIKEFLSLFENPTSIVDLMLQFCSETDNIFVLCECYACCYVAGEMAHSSENAVKTIEAIHKRKEELLEPTNINHLMRFAVKTKTLPEFIIDVEENEPISLPKIMLLRMFQSRTQNKQFIPQIEEKSCFENQVYFVSDLKDIQNSEDFRMNANYEAILSDSYAILNTAMEGGLFYFEKANKITQDFVLDLNNPLNRGKQISNYYSYFIGALKCFARAIGFFIRQEEYYWVNKCIDMIGIISLQIYYDNVQLIGLPLDRANTQLIYFESFEDAYLFAKHYNLMETLKWAKALYHQVINGNTNYIDQWLSMFVLDRPTLIDILNSFDRDERSGVIKKKESSNWEYFIVRVKSRYPSLYYPCKGELVSTDEIPHEFKLMIQHARLDLNSLFN